MRKDDSFQNIFRALLVDADLTHPEAAAYLGVSKRTVDVWSAGGEPSSELLAEAALTKLRHARALRLAQAAPRKVRRGRKPRELQE